MRIGSLVIAKAADTSVEKGRGIAGIMLETPAADIEFAHGHFVVKGTDRSVGLFKVAAAAFGNSIPAELRGPLTRIADETIPNCGRAVGVRSNVTGLPISRPPALPTHRG